jgi:GH18 family chitinase
MHKKNEDFNHGAQKALTQSEKAALRRLREQLKEQQRETGRTSPLRSQIGARMDALPLMELPTA